MRRLASYVLYVCLLAGNQANAQAGNVEVVRLCVSTVSLIKEAIGAMELFNQKDSVGAKQKYGLALKEHYDDWMVFSLVMGPQASKVIMTNYSMGVVLTSIEDCLNGQTCRADEFKENATHIWSELPLACQSDYRG